MTQVDIEVEVPVLERRKEKFEVEIIYNGLEKKFKIEEDKTVKQLLDQAIQHFHAQQPHLLALYTTAGKELTNESQTVKQAGIRSKDKLLLRPSQVRGG